MQRRSGMKSEILNEPSSQFRLAWIWPIITVLVTLGVAASRLLLTPRFYVWDDTQNGTIGQLYALGSSLLNGHIPMLNLSVWQGGNYWAEGQWGLINPLIWVFALISHALPSQTTIITAMKLILLMLGALGVYYLGRSFRLSPSWACIAGISVQLIGFTVYIDAASWTSGLMCSTVFPWAWFGIERVVRHNRSSIIFLISSYCLITTGYVYGTLMLAVLILGYLILCWGDATTETKIKIFLLGIYSGLLAIVIYLPGILTSSFTVRSETGIINNNFLNADLSDLSASGIATGITTIKGYWGDVSPVPLIYTSWLILFIPLISWKRAWKRLRTKISALTLPGIVALIFILGPSEMGPLRYFLRLSPYLALSVILIVALLLDTNFQWPITINRFFLTTLIIGVSTWISWAQSPGHILDLMFSSGVPFILLCALFLMSKKWPHRGRVLTDITPLLALSITLILTMFQLLQYPSSPLGDFHNMARTNSYKAVAANRLKSGSTLVIGNVHKLQSTPAAYHEVVLANQWYLTGNPAMNVYTVLPVKHFSTQLCMDYFGSTCGKLARTIFKAKSSTKVPLVDLLSINNIITLNSTVKTGLTGILPDDWRLVSTGKYTKMYQRKKALHTLGTPVLSTANFKILSNTSTQLRLRIPKNTHGKIVLSRLAWPGYTVSGATLSAPTDKYLLTIKVSKAESSKVVTITFRPPGWGLEVSSLILALMLGTALVIQDIRVQKKKTD